MLYFATSLSTQITVYWCYNVIWPFHIGNKLSKAISSMLHLMFVNTGQLTNYSTP